MTIALALLATLAGTLGACLLYLVSPHQKLRARPLPRRAGLIGGICSLAASLALFHQVSGLAAAVFIWLTLAMLLWSVPPLAIALWDQRRKARP